MKKILGMMWLGLWVIPVWAADPAMLSLGLVQAEQAGQEHSGKFQAKQHEASASRAGAESQYALLWPKLSLEGSYTYLSNVSTLQLALPGRTINMTMGDHNNYSVGLQATWNAWDSLAVYNSWKAMQAAVTGKDAELQLLTRQIKLQVQLGYFQTQLAFEKMQLLVDALNLSQKQYQDIQAKARVGSASRLETLSSHLEVVAKEKQLRSARLDLSLALRDLLRLLGAEKSAEVSQPWGNDPDRPLPKKFEAATVLVTLDPLEASLQRFEKQAALSLDPDHPQAALYAAMAESAAQSAESLASGHWPKLSLMAKTSMDYPNGLVPETVNQNTLNVKGSWSIWENNRVVNQVEEKNQQAQVQKTLEQDARQDLQLNWQKAQDRLLALHKELELNQEIVKETKELARVAYQTYQIGRADYIEVQSANLRALEATTQSALTQVQILIQLAMLESLSKEKE